MLIAVEVYQKEFTDRTMKNAYLQACKWVSGEFIAVNNSKDLTYKFEKQSGKGLPTILLKVYAMLDEEEIHNRHCNICKQATELAYLKQNKYQCEVCKVNPYRERIKNEVKNKINGMEDIYKWGLKKK